MHIDIQRTIIVFCIERWSLALIQWVLKLCIQEAHNRTFIVWHISCQVLLLFGRFYFICSQFCWFTSGLFSDLLSILLKQNNFVLYNSIWIVRTTLYSAFCIPSIQVLSSTFVAAPAGVNSFSVKQLIVRICEIEF